MLIQHSQDFRLPLGPLHSNDLGGAMRLPLGPLHSKVEPRTFPLEGKRDLFQSLAGTPSTGGPLCPSIGQQLQPAYQALEATTRALGKHPDPWEVDRSNVRRIVRTLTTMMEIHQNSYPAELYDKAQEALAAGTRCVGRYKDVGILEDTLRLLYPQGNLPTEIDKALDKEKHKREEAFLEDWNDFTRSGLSKVSKCLKHPLTQETTPQALLREDARRHRLRVEIALEEVELTGLDHQDPEQFHAGRKSLRKLVHSLQASRDSVPLEDPDLKRLSHVVDGLGVAQDFFIAYHWLDKKGFPEPAARAKERYRELHDHEVQGACQLEESGIFQKIRSLVK